MDKIVNYFSTFDLENALPIIQGSVGIIAVCLSFFTFRIAIRAQRAIVKNHSLNRQLDAMTELLKYLNDSKININFWELTEDGGVGTSTPIFYNIFEIGKLLNDKQLLN